MTESGWSPPVPAERHGRLTWAQHEWVQWIPTDSPTSFEDNICAAVPGRDAPREAVVAAVRDVVLRHEGLRSVIERGQGDRARQHVTPVDAFLGDIIEVTGQDPGGPRFDTPWRRTCFRIGAEWPIKVVLFVRGAAVRRVDLVVDHVAIDPWAMTVLCRDLSLAIRSRAAGREPFAASPPAEQPIDAAEAEVTPAGQAYQRRALRYWERRLTGLRDGLDGFTPRAEPPAPPVPLTEYGGFRSCWLTSRRAGEAAGVLARTRGISASAAFLLAFGAAVCAVEASPLAGLFAISANRLSAGAAGSVRKATMTLPVLVPRPTGATFARALADCAAQQLHGHRFANADPYATERMCEDVLGGLYKTAVAYPRFSYMDGSIAGDFGTAWSASRGAFDDEEVTFAPPRLLGAKYMLTVLHRAEGAVLSLQWSDETHWGDGAEAMLRHMEDLMVWAASGQTAGMPVFGRDRVAG
ncbi:condensation domain-containing protein [Sphaerisporangium corydalis]|uniref:Condensation domain-containing protein n=1 Tax=Sphaerisporangium corydalis TaxID=1441875 RepID=A0ABV9E5U6_9ACTN|nr:hypothetical protein [Sphaerisporangium corydalis]